MDAPALEKQAKVMNKFLFPLGFITVIFGITLVLRQENWDAAVIVFKGIVPPLIAIAGLVLMFAASLKK